MKQSNINLQNSNFDPWKPTTKSLVVHYRTVTGIALACLCGAVTSAGYWGYCRFFRTDSQDRDRYSSHDIDNLVKDAERRGKATNN